MARYLFSSHDGFGLGHVRRNTLIARAILARDPDAAITIVTGLAVRPSWLGDPRLKVVQVPSLVKDSLGAYRNDTMAFEDALERRADAFAGAVRAVEPDVVLVDRHPYGIGGELGDGLDVATRSGAALVVGLRDILDEPKVVAQEMAGGGWQGVSQRYDALLVYGERVLCDHELEYAVPIRPTYCGWVVDVAPSRPRDARLLVVTGGGGGDGAAVFHLGVELTAQLPSMRTVLVAGPFATRRSSHPLTRAMCDAGRLRVVRDAPGCADLFAEACGVVQMAGYNSTFESLAAGIRPVLVPRRNPRREQAIRASRLAALGLADVVDESAAADEVAWLLQRSRLLHPDALTRAGVRLDGADRTAVALRSLVPARMRAR